MSDIISDAVAESLENSALWRRAATRWLEVMWCCQTDEEREWISRRRS
ncbi:PerC family transcriptional regulator, partial [Escherichia coli]